MSDKGGKWSGVFNSIKIFVDLFKLILISLIRFSKKLIDYLNSFIKAELNKTEKETNSPEINKEEISYNKFGFPIYRDRNNKK